jgi:eukaryotic-like serine/threonine-protein kinase
MKEQIPSVCKINEEIPQSIENIILKACAKNPKNRYESAREMYEDIKSCLDADKQNEKRYVYKFPEQELEKTKKIPLLSKINTNIDERIEKTMSDKTTNKFIILGTLVTAFLSLLILGIVIIYPMLVKVPEVKIPDVSGKTPLQAEEMLRELGLTVASTDEEKPSEYVEEGLVIETKPGYNRSVKKGTEVTLVISKGTEKITLSDYTNLNFYEIKTLLETKGIIVLQEQKEVEELNDLKEYTIIDQFPLKDTILQSGDTVTLYTPKIITEYPDFVGEKWTLDEVNEFLANYEIVPRVKYEIREDVEPGTVVFQSRLAGSIIQNKAIFSITVASAPEDVEPDNLETE